MKFFKHININEKEDMDKIKMFNTLAIVSLLSAIAATTSLAKETKTVNGRTYVCQNSCVIDTTGGGVRVRDSAGGYVVEIPKTNVEAPQEP